MKKYLLAVIGVATCVTQGAFAQQSATGTRRLPVAEYRDKMAAGWIGQMAGVGWGAPTEFKFNAVMVPEDKVPKWKPSMINQFGQDDIYVEMTFLRTLEQYGYDVSIRQAGIDFANSGYRLWHANRYGRENLRAGIAPPDSGHPQFNRHADDIDYQIEADYAGLIAPGMPNVGIELGEKFGRLMNYGDGMYGGQFVAGMYAEAFFEEDPVAIVKAGLKCIPAGSQYAEAIRDVLAWHAEQPDDWQATWTRIDGKYRANPDYRRASCGKGGSCIDAKLNGAYIVMGLLYGKRDLDQTIVISMRCGQDSDCNPSNAGGVLFTTIGRKNLPPRFTSELRDDRLFSHTAYNFPGLITVCEQLVRKIVLDQGGKIETAEDGSEVFVIPVVEAKPSSPQCSWQPGPIANSRFTDEEKAKISPPAPQSRHKGHSLGRADLSEAVQEFASGWTVTDCGSDTGPGLWDECRGRKRVLVLHPLSTETPCVLSRELTVPQDANAKLLLDVSHDLRGDWTLAVKVDGKVVLQRKVDRGAVGEAGWLTVEVPLGAFVGKQVKLAVENHADGWHYEAAYIARIVTP